MHVMVGATYSAICCNAGHSTCCARSC